MSAQKIMSKKQLNKYPKKFIIEFLQLYESLPCLWKVKHEDYFDRAKKDQAYHVVVDKMLEVENFPDRPMAISLFRALRLDYNKQLKRLDQCPGRKPTLWYFQHINFLKNCERRPYKSLVIGLPKNETIEQKPTDNNIDADDVNDNSQFLDDESSALSIVEASEISEINQMNSEDDLIDLRSEGAEEQPTSQYYEELGTSWANVLRQLPYQQNIIARKLINDIIYEASMDKLNENTPTHIFNILQSE